MTKPNILIIMVDQLTGTLFQDGPADWLHTPNLKKLAERSTRFQNAYCASPLCAPARAAYMAGQLPSSTKVYDNAAEFASSIPTYAHHLRRAGYQTCLSGKMHFVGADQLHGFEERLTTDIYPADFGWTPDYRKPGERIDWWYHNMGSVTGAGVAEITNQMEYDDEVAYNACRKLYDLARGHDERPWCLTVSFTHPHDPYVARKKYWDLYEDCEHLEPEVGPIPYEEQDQHSQRLMDSTDYNNFDLSEENTRRSRRAYFANISYIDDKVGELLDVLERTRQDASIVFLSDHGDMLGEHGLWFKMSFYEGSSRIPLMICDKTMEPGLVTDPVSAIDVTPTLCDLAGIDMGEVSPWVDGESIAPLGRGVERTSPVMMEYAAEGSYAPLISLVSGQYKFNQCQLDPDQLFDLEKDPHELNNVAGDPAYAQVLADMKAKAAERWDMARFDNEVRQSQARRWIAYEALTNGKFTAWDHQPMMDASNRYMRNHMDLNVVEENQRFPRGE
ncbi:choline-sulfatase [Marivivens donghaensis]|uniref:Choline-sulfatase n=1 Tax=Marivivens donghaensis TaxID=1699413 RepID=A0ABX0VW09_9RHOB|nr:choline-sulfatase [Marivivens donghaensis]NIY72248.1 choline-sulfatase [Marivivens donghaensis]